MPVLVLTPRQYVPARMGGVDLSFSDFKNCIYNLVPARMGGVDLSPVTV